MVRLQFACGLFPLSVGQLAEYVVADQRDNEGLPLGPVDGVCTFYGKLEDSTGLNPTPTLINTFPDAWDWATIPHPLNHSSTILLNCSDLLVNVGQPGFCRYCKEYAVCKYGSCLKDAQVTDQCCSLLSTPPPSNPSKCNDIALPYNPITGTLASCEFDYDLYDFGSSATLAGSAVALILLGLVMLM